MLTISSHKGNANQNHPKIHLTPVRIAIIKTPPITCVGYDAGKKELLSTAGGDASWCNNSGKKFGDFLKI
jgi:hypothetical protein